MSIVEISVRKRTRREQEAFDMGVEYGKRIAGNRGRWVATAVPDVYQCTHCKKATKMDELCDSEVLRRFCPNCGARMKVVYHE